MSAAPPLAEAPSDLRDPTPDRSNGSERKGATVVLNGRSSAALSLNRVNSLRNSARRSNRLRHSPRESERDGVGGEGAEAGAAKKLLRPRHSRSKLHVSRALPAPRPPLRRALRKRTTRGERLAPKVMVRSGAGAFGVGAGAVVAGRKADRRQQRRSGFSVTILRRLSD
jgi:hypothetical protein